MTVYRYLFYRAGKRTWEMFNLIIFLKVIKVAFGNMDKY